MNQESAFDKISFRRATCTLWGGDELIDIAKNWKSISFAIMGREICPTTNRKHLQCYFEFNNSVKGKTLRNKFGDLGAKKSKGTAEQNIKYCSKENNFETWGEVKKQGQRTDITELTTEIINGETTVDEIVETDPIFFHQYGRTLERAEALRLRRIRRTWMTEGFWFFGETGSGKSKRAYEFDSDENTYVLDPQDRGWWDNYTGQRTVIIDDFRGEIPYNQLLRMIDRNQYACPRRGKAPFPLLAKTIIITSSLSPDKVYHNRNAEDKISQLLRRCKVRYCENINEDRIWDFDEDNDVASYTAPIRIIPRRSRSTSG